MLNMTKQNGQHGRHRGDSNPCGQSPMDFESISLATRTQCLCFAIGIAKYSANYVNQYLYAGVLLSWI